MCLCIRNFPIHRSLHLCVCVCVCVCVSVCIYVITHPHKTGRWWVEGGPGILWPELYFLWTPLQQKHAHTNTHTHAHTLITLIQTFGWHFFWTHIVSLMLQQHSTFNKSIQLNSMCYNKEICIRGCTFCGGDCGCMCVWKHMHDYVFPSLCVCVHLYVYFSIIYFLCVCVCVCVLACLRYICTIWKHNLFSLQTSFFGCPTAFGGVWTGVCVLNTWFFILYWGLCNLKIDGF